MESLSASKRMSWDITPDERVQADELINELRTRLITLRERKDAAVKDSRSYSSGGTETTLIEVGPRRVVIKEWLNHVTVSLNGFECLSLTGVNLDYIDLGAMSEALIGLRQRLILDDLAAI